MIKTIVYTALMIATHASIAAEGYVIAEDLNGDNIQDLIASGPIGQFGNAGGPFLLRISNNDGTYEETVVGLSPIIIMIENGNPPKLWSFWKSGASNASMFSITLDSRFTKKVEPLNLNGSIDAASFEKYFSTLNMLKFHQLLKYTPPPHTTIGWGK